LGSDLGEESGPRISPPGVVERKMVRATTELVMVALTNHVAIAFILSGRGANGISAEAFIGILQSSIRESVMSTGSDAGLDGGIGHVNLLGESAHLNVIRIASLVLPFVVHKSRYGGFRGIAHVKVQAIAGSTVFMRISCAWLVAFAEGLALASTVELKATVAFPTEFHASICEASLGAEL